MLHRRTYVGAAAGFAVLAISVGVLYFASDVYHQARPAAVSSTGISGSALASRVAQSNPVVKLATSGSIDPTECTAEKQYAHATVVVVGAVTEILPLRQNIDERVYSGKEEDGYLPVYYMGYRMSISKWMGTSPSRTMVTVYSIGNGTGVIDGKTVEHTSEFDPGIEVGQTYVVPLQSKSPYGVPLKDGEFWAVGSGISIYKLDGENAVRAVPLEGPVSSLSGQKNASTLKELVGLAGSVGLPEQSAE